MISDEIVNGVNNENLREKLLKDLNISLEKAEQECKRYETTKTRLKEMAKCEMRDLHCRQESDLVEERVSGANEYQSNTSDYQSRPVEYQPVKEYPIQPDHSSSLPSTPDYQPIKEFHTAQQEYQNVPEYQTIQPDFQSEYQSVQPEYHPVPHQPSTPQQASRSSSYGSPTHRVVPLRRTESRTFVPAPPQQRAGSPLNFQPQNYPRPPPNSYRPNVNQPINQTQQYRPQLPRREESPSPNQEYQRIYINQLEKNPNHFNPVPRESPSQPQNQPQSPQSPQPPPIQRPTPQPVVRRPNPWALLKQKLPADVRQQFIPIRRPQFEGRAMQSPDQGKMQRPPGDGQPINTVMNKGGSPNSGMQSPNQVLQNPNLNSMYNGRPPSGNPPQKMGMTMQRPMSQEGRDSPSPVPVQSMQRAMSGERRSPFDMQRSDSMRNIDPRSMTSPQPGISPPQGMYSPSPPRPTGPPRTPRPAGDDDDDVVYSQGNDSRMNLGRGQTPPLRPPSAPRPGPISPDVNREINSSRPLSRTESRQSFEVRSPSGMDSRGEPKLMTRDSPLSRPMNSADLVRTPFQYRPENQHTPPSSPKPEFQSPKPSISPQESIDRQKVESRSSSQNSFSTSKITPDLRPNSKMEDKQDSGKHTPVNGNEGRNSSPQPPLDISMQDSKPETPNVSDKSPIGASPIIVKSNEHSRSATPSSTGGKDVQQNEHKSPNVSQNTTPTPNIFGNDSGTTTPLPDKSSTSVTDSALEESPVKTPDRIATPDLNKTDVERPKSLKRSPSLKQDLANSPDYEGRKTPLTRTPSRNSSASKGNDNKSPLQRKSSGKRPKTPKTPDGDHDSGVDETTQKKDGPTTNGDLSSPSKSPSKIPAPKRLSMPSPTKSTKVSPKTPEAPPTAEKKKVPMNKIQVGAAPSPNLKTVKSKIGSLQNTTHKPGGGNIKIENRKLDWRAEPRIAAKNDAYQPGGGDKKIQQVKLQWNAKSKIGSLENATHKPGGGEKKIENIKLDFKDKAKSKVGSKDNIKHSPGGGNVKTPSQDGSAEANSGDIEDHKLDVKAQSKIGSLENVKHRPGGGDKKIFDDKDYLRQMSGTTSKAGSEGIPSGTQGDDGWSSANTSRRTSRDRRRSGDRRYRSESRLGQRTPEPKVSPKEEHCSLREKYSLQQQDILQEAETITKETEVIELVSPLRPTSSASEQTMTRDSSEDKDLNSNQTNSQSDTSETKKDEDVGTIFKTQLQMNTNSSDMNNQGETSRQVRLLEVEKKEEKPISVTLENKDAVQENISLKDVTANICNEDTLITTQPNQQDAVKEDVNTLTANEPNGNITQKLHETTLKTEFKEDMVKEIKEVDSKEIEVKQSDTKINDKNPNQQNKFEINNTKSLEESTKLNAADIHSQNRDEATKS